jgi:hypothetical protein
MAKDSLLNIILNIVKQGTGDKDAKDGMADLEGQLGNTALALAAEVVGFTTLTGAIFAGIAALKSCIDAAAQAETATTQLGATLLSTGRAGEISTQQIAALGASMSGLFDTTQIEQAATVLLRYMDIPTDQIPGDLRMLENYAAEMGGTLPDAANVLGRALESGTTRNLGFSREMSNTITTMMSAGDIAGADALIMEQFNDKFSGQASADLMTYAGATQAVSTSMDNLKAASGSDLLSNFTLIKLTFADLINEYIEWESLQNGGKPTGLAAYAGEVDYSKMSTAALNSELDLVNNALATTTTETGKAMAGHAQLAIQTELDARAHHDFSSVLKDLPAQLQNLKIATDDSGTADYKDTKYVSDMTGEYKNLITQLGQMSPRTIAVGEAFGLLTDQEITAMTNLHNFDADIQAWGNKPITKTIVLDMWYQENDLGYGGKVTDDGSAPAATTSASTGSGGKIQLAPWASAADKAYAAAHPAQYAPVTGNAAGGPVGPGTSLWNEGGRPEVLVTGSGGMIISHDEAMKSLGGGVTINLSVNGAGDPGAVAREVIRQLGTTVNLQGARTRL